MYEEPDNYHTRFGLRRFIQGAGLGIAVSFPLLTTIDSLWFRIFYPSFLALVMGFGFSCRPLSRINPRALIVLLVLGMVALVSGLLVWFVTR